MRSGILLLVVLLALAALTALLWWRLKGSGRPAAPAPQAATRNHHSLRTFHYGPRGGYYGNLSSRRYGSSHRSRGGPFPAASSGRPGRVGTGRLRPGATRRAGFGGCQHCPGRKAPGRAGRAGTRPAGIHPARRRGPGFAAGRAGCAGRGRARCTGASAGAR